MSCFILHNFCEINEEVTSQTNIQLENINTGIITTIVVFNIVDIRNPLNYQMFEFV